METDAWIPEQLDGTQSFFAAALAADELTTIPNLW